MVRTEWTEYAGWEKCLRLTNGELEVVCTTRVGPRIVHAGLKGGQNLCYLDEDAGAEPDDEDWHLFGGHRLWHAPERDGRTDRPDNDPVRVDQRGDVVTLTQPTEPETGVRKQLTVRLSDDAPRATLTHRLVNEGRWPIDVAPWAITVLKAGGTAVLPVAERDTGRQADRNISLWPYTDLGDDRLAFEDDAVLVEGQERDADPTKIGVDGGDDWAAYVLDGTALCKEFVRYEGETYPDRGAAAQVFTDGSMLELETLGALETIGPGESTTHVEEWTLLDDVADPTGEEPGVDLLSP